MSTNETSKTVDVTTARACERCKGEGRTHSQWAKDNGFEGPEGRHCNSCNGKGSFDGLDIKALVDSVFTTKGGKKSFRKSFPSKLNRYQDKFAARSYYIWRLARFHGGADVTMPVTADMVTGGDPFKKELNLVAEYVARAVFGTDEAAVTRWGLALGLINEAPKGLPATAYECGPVTDGNKPAFEAPELR